MTATTLREAVAASLYEDSCRADNNETMNSFLSWAEYVEINGPRSRVVLRYMRRADAALAVIRAHCLGRVREIHSRIHMTDSDEFAEQVRQRALVAWQLAEDCNTSAAGAAGGATDDR